MFTFSGRFPWVWVPGLVLGTAVSPGSLEWSGTPSPARHQAEPLLTSPLRQLMGRAPSRSLSPPPAFPASLLPPGEDELRLLSQPPPRAPLHPLQPPPPAPSPGQLQQGHVHISIPGRDTCTSLSPPGTKQAELGQARPRSRSAPAIAPGACGLQPSSSSSSSATGSPHCWWAKDTGEGCEGPTTTAARGEAGGQGCRSNIRRPSAPWLTKPWGAGFVILSSSLR